MSSTPLSHPDRPHLRFPFILSIIAHAGCTLLHSLISSHHHLLTASPPPLTTFSPPHLPLISLSSPQPCYTHIIQRPTSRHMPTLPTMRTRCCMPLLSLSRSLSSLSAGKFLVPLLIHLLIHAPVHSTRRLSYRGQTPLGHTTPQQTP